MTQRNPMNERYQNNGEKNVGKTRKSAASAKPVTKAASSVRVVDPSAKKQSRGLFGGKKNTSSSTKSSKEKQAERVSSQPVLTPEEMVEYKKWGRIRNILFGVAIALTLMGPLVFFRTGMATSGYYVVLGIGYAAIIAAIYVDLRKVQKLRRKNVSTRTDDRSKKATKQRKEAKAAAKARAEQEAAQAALVEEAKAMKEAEKGKRGLFGKKK